MSMRLDKFLGDHKVVIIDVGAAGGVHERFDIFENNLTTLLFEPREEAYNNLPDENGVIKFNYGLDEHEGERTLNLTNKLWCSSILKPKYDFLERFPYVERYNIDSKVNMAVKPLDSIRGSVEYFDFLKIDTQGTTFPIIKGGVKVLESLFAIEVETEFNAIYEGQILFHEVDRFLRVFDFELFDMQRYFWCRNTLPAYQKTRGQIIFANVVYFKTREALAKMLGAITNSVERKNRAKSLFSLLLAYRQYDYLLELVDFFKEQDLVSFSKEELRIVNGYINDGKESSLPDFRGKRYIYRILKSITDWVHIFRPRKWFWVDNDL